jgi:hypothetical protein
VPALGRSSEAWRDGAGAWRSARVWRRRRSIWVTWRGDSTAACQVPNAWPGTTRVSSPPAGLGLVAMVARRRGAITPTPVCGTHIHIGWGAPAEVMVQGAAHSSMATRDIKPRTADRTVSPTARDEVGGDYFP